MARSRLPSFIKLPSYYQFDYKPRYYDPVKEKAEEKEGKVNLEKGGHERYSSRLIGQFKRQRHMHRKQMAGRSGSAQRTLMLAGILTVPMLYYIGEISGFAAIAVLVVLFFLFALKLRQLT